MKLTFNDQHLIITGGTGALGSAVTELLIDAGARCSIPCFNEAELKNFPLEGQKALFISTGVDLTDEEAAFSFFEKATSEMGALSASVHIAGGFEMGKIGDTTLEAFMKQIRINLITCYNSCRAAVERFRSAKKGGKILNVASRPALEPRQGAGRSAYTTSKAGVAALTASLAEELVGEDILINAIAPSIIDTAANRDAMPDADYTKWPKPAEIANQILYLVSEQNTVTRGAVIPVYGKR